MAINKPNISALAPNEKLLLLKTINHQLLSILKGIDETKNTTINLVDELSIKTAKLIVGAALQFRCRRMDEKTEKSQYIKRTSERLQIIKEVCDLTRQLKSHPRDKEEKTERLMELDILMDRLSMCDIPNLPIPLNQHTIQTWAEQHADEQIEYLETCLKLASKQDDQKEQMRRRDLFLNPRTRGKWLDLHFKTSPPAMQNFAIYGNGRIVRAPEDVKRIYLAEGTLFLGKKLETRGPEEEAKRTFAESKEPVCGK